MSGLGIGEQLAQAREARGCTLEDAERDTRISRQYLEALEDEQFDRIPAPVYARGFLRSYSQYLGIEANALLARFPREPAAYGSGASGGPVSREIPPGGDHSGPSAARLQREPTIGIDIGVAIPVRRMRTGPLLTARTAALALVALLVTVVVVVLAIAIANLGDGAGSATPLAATPAPGEAALSSGLAIERGVVPDVIGQIEDVARRAVQDAGFEITVVRASSDQYPRGMVFEQAPAAGVEREPGRGVFIVVSEGP